MLLVVAIAGVGCGVRSAPPPARDTAAQRYELIHPPDVPDARYPGGVHLRSDAPLASWHRVAAFATREHCETSRTRRIDDTIDEARAEVGEDAKYQLPVRRAVNARCVPVR